MESPRFRREVRYGRVLTIILILVVKGGCVLFITLVSSDKMDLDSDATEDERPLESEQGLAPSMGKRRTSSVRFDDKPTVVSFEK